MKKICLIILIGACAACSKSHDNPAPASPPASLTRIKKQTSGGNVYTYSYDSQGKAMKMENNDGSRKEYEYATGKVTRKYYNSAGVYQSSNSEELNPDGFSVRSTTSSQPTWETLFTYNADKTLAKIISQSNSITVKDYFWNKGNLDSIRFSSQNGTWNYTNVMTYYIDKPNVLSDDVFGEPYWGMNSKNLLKSSVNHFPDGSSSVKNDYTYEFDSQSRVTKETITVDNGNIYITLNTYN
jgi:YD repeat-containing protein